MQTDILTFYCFTTKTTRIYLVNEGNLVHMILFISESVFQVFVLDNKSFLVKGLSLIVYLHLENLFFVKCFSSH